MSLAYTGMSGRGQVATLVSLFSIHMSKLYKQNKMAGVTENYSKFKARMVVRFLQAEGVSQNKIHCRLVFTARMFQLKGSVYVMQQI
jgi:hypothetical protein